MDLGAMAMKRYFVFPKAPALLEPCHQIVSCHILDPCWGGGVFLPLCREVVSVFYSPNRLGKRYLTRKNNFSFSRFGCSSRPQRENEKKKRKKKKKTRKDKRILEPGKIYIYIYIYIYIGFGSISSLIQISLNIIDILCLHIFFWIRSYCCITFIVFGGNWFMYCP